MKIPNYITTSTRQPWDCIAEKFELMEDSLSSWRIQTYEEALNLAENKLQWYDRERDKLVDPWLQIPYVKQVDDDAITENFEEAKKLLQHIRPYIEKREICPQFLDMWGDLCERYGYLSCQFFSLESELGYVRAGVKGAEAKNRDSQRQWLAHILLEFLDSGCKPKDAERKAAKLIKDIIKHRAINASFDEDWFGIMVNANGTLRETYCQKHFSRKRMRVLVKEPTDNIPPLKYYFPKT